jgi:transketolase
VDAPAERRPSVARLTAALLAGLPDGEARGLVLALCLIFARHMRFDAADPGWADRDRMLVDPGLDGVGAALADLAGAGFAPPCPGREPVLGLGVGAALAERLLAARFGRSLVDHRCWVAAAEASLPEGAVLEAAQLAGAWRLSRLVALVSVAQKDAAGLAGFGAAGWSVRRVAAADGGEIAAAISAAMRAQRPTLIACVRGAEAGEDQAGGQLGGQMGGQPGGQLGEQALKQAGAQPGGQAGEQPGEQAGEQRGTHPGGQWSEAGGEAAVAESRAAWAVAACRGRGVRRAWLKRRARHGSRGDFELAISGRLAQGWHQAFFGAGPAVASLDTVSTEACMRQSVRRLLAASPEVALLAPPEPGLRRLSRGLADAAAGVAWHGGVLPIVSARLDEAPALDAALRVAAAGRLRLVALVEEGGPGVDGGGRRAALRALPGLGLYRPAEASEAMECAELAVRHHGPGVLLLSGTPAEPLAERPSRTRCVKGGYVLVEAIGPRAGTLIASGPEVALALAVQEVLAEREVETAVVSLPSWNVFFAQDAAWRERVLGAAPRLGLEPGGGIGWGEVLGPDGLFIGLDGLPDGLWTTGPRALQAARIADIAVRHIERVHGIWTGEEASRKRTGFERSG